MFPMASVLAGPEARVQHEEGGEEKVEDGGRSGEPFGKCRQPWRSIVTSEHTQGHVCDFSCLLTELVGI